MKLLTWFAIFCSLLVVAYPAIAGNGWKKAMAGRTLGICKPKIEAKNLKGDARKAAWASCRADPESYN